MNKIVEISNPMLVGAMQLVKKDNTPENRKVFMDEILHAKFLAPVIITPSPELDESGNAKFTPDSQMNVPMITVDEGKCFFMAFTDLGEMREVKLEGYVSVLPFTLKDYAAMIAQADETCQGFVINPYCNGLIVSKAMVSSMIDSQKKPEADERKKEN